ncbi:MAG TPA: hypothetical protein VGD34_17545 [Kribbella sp.]
MDEVKKLLTEFADRAVDGLPPADVDAAVARGRRALFRIKARRRVTGVLCIAAATTAVVTFGNQVNWWDGGGTEVATGTADTDTARAATPTPAASPSVSDVPMPLSVGAAIALVPNKESWSRIACTLAPQGWTPEKPVAADRVVLTPPSVRTSDDTAKLVLRSATGAQGLQSVRVIQAAGKVFHLGTAAGREVGQVQLGNRWLVVQLPVQHQDWTDDVLRRFMGSCNVS